MQANSNQIRMLKDESNTIKSVTSTTNSNNNSSNKTTTTTQANDPQQSSKDRTLFCVNIHEKCTEDILFELFLQAGPIENIVRKADKNGTLICLITYKHVQSCEYAIALYNGIKLFDKELRVKQSDLSSSSNKDTQNLSRYSQIYSSNNNRGYNSNRLSIDGQYQQKMISQPTTPQALMPTPQSLMPPPPFQQLLAQAFTNLSPSLTGDFSMNPQLNRSWSGNMNMNMNDNDNYTSSRRNSNNFDFNNRNSNNNNRRSHDYGRDYSNSKHNHHDQSKSRDRRSEYHNDRSRSRSPARKRNRR